MGEGGLARRLEAQNVPLFFCVHLLQPVITNLLAYIGISLGGYYSHPLSPLFLLEALIVHPCSTIQVVINKTNDLKPFCNVLFL
jgi:hypothetical protein